MERVGIVLGSMLMLALPASYVLLAVAGTTTAWWGPVALLGPGFVVGWAVASDLVPFDYDTVWFVCFAGYVLAALGFSALELQPLDEHQPAAFAILACGLVVAAAVDYYWR